MAEPRPGTVWGDTTSPEGENRRLFIGQIPKNCTLADLREKFEKHGKIEGMAIKAGYAFLQYSRPKEAVSAVVEDKTKILGSTIGVRAYRTDKPPPKKSKPFQKDRSRSPPPLRNRVVYDDWGVNVPNEFSAPNRTSSNLIQSDSSIGNEVEVVVWERNPDANQEKYAQQIEHRVRQETNIRTVDTILLKNQYADQLPDLLNDLYQKKTLYAIVVGPLDPVNLTATLYLIRDTSAPRYRSLDEVIQIISLDYQSTYHGQPPSFRNEQFSRPVAGIFSPQLSQTSQPPNEPYARTPGPNIQARLGGYKLEDSKPLYDNSSVDLKYSRVDNAFGFNLPQGSCLDIKSETKPKLEPTKPFVFASSQRPDPLANNEKKMPKDVELSLRLILEQGHCRSMSEIQLESIIDYLQNQKAILKQQMNNPRVKEEIKPDIKNNIQDTNNAPLTNAFNILSQAGIISNFADPIRQQQHQVHVKEEQSDEPLIVQEKIANKPSQNASNQAVNGSHIDSVINSAFDVIQKAGISVRPNIRSNNLTQNNANQNAESFHNPNFQNAPSRRHPLNGNQIYPDTHQSTSYSSGRF